MAGKDAPGLSPTAIACLKDGWLNEHEAWQKRDLSTKRYVYVWAMASTCKPGSKMRRQWSSSLSERRSGAEKLTRSRGHNQLPKLILVVKFTDGLAVVVKRGNLQPATAAT